MVRGALFEFSGTRCPELEKEGGLFRNQPPAGTLCLTPPPLDPPHSPIVPLPTFLRDSSLTWMVKALAMAVGGDAGRASVKPASGRGSFLFPERSERAERRRSMQKNPGSFSLSHSDVPPCARLFPLAPPPPGVNFFCVGGCA